MNIQRQTVLAVPDWRMNSAVAWSGIFSAISQLAACPPTIPMKMVSW